MDKGTVNPIQARQIRRNSFYTVSGHSDEPQAMPRFDLKVQMLWGIHGAHDARWRRRVLYIMIDAEPDYPALREPGDSQ